MEDQIEVAEAIEIEAPSARSVVASSYKAHYRAVAESARLRKGLTKKVMKRTCCDWLAQELAERTVQSSKLNVPLFEAILDANGVKHDHYNRTTKGWQGRLRMTGRLALQRVVAANDGKLALPDGSYVDAPRNWVAKHIH